MGTYTKVKVLLTLRRDAPDEICNMVRSLVEDRWVDSKALKGQFFDGVHSFFSNERFYCIFGNHTGDHDCFAEWDCGTVNCVSSVKNYDGLVDDFCDWVTPYVDIGYPFLITTTSEDRSYDWKQIVHVVALENVSLAQFESLLDEADSQVYMESKEPRHVKFIEDFRRLRTVKGGEYDGPYVPKRETQQVQNVRPVKKKSPFDIKKRRRKLAAASRRKNRK